MADGEMPAAEGLAIDESLFLALDAGTGGEVLRIWEAVQPAVIVGAFGRVAREVRDEVCRHDGVPVLRRCSGGGAVVIGPGCLNYTLVLSLDRRPAMRQVSASYDVILRRICTAIAYPGLRPVGPGDLALGDRKIGGSAQRRGRHALLHHGTLLYGFDLTRIARYLPLPTREPAYRGGRAHEAFVTNLPVPRPALAAALTSILCVTPESPSASGRSPLVHRATETQGHRDF